MNKGKSNDTFNLDDVFRKYIGAELEKKGFKRIKSRYPYYVRTVNGEIIHAVTYIEKHNIYTKLRSFEVYGGVGTIYRPGYDFSAPPENLNWLRNTFYINGKLFLDEEDYPYTFDEIGLCFDCSIEPDKTGDDMKRAWEYVDNILIYALDKFTDIDSVINDHRLIDISMFIYEDDDFGKGNSAYNDNEGLLLIKNDSRQAIIDSNLRELHWAEKEIKIGRSAIVSYEMYRNNLEECLQRHLNAFDRIRNSEELYSKALQELERRAERNRTDLPRYGIEI